MVPRGGSARFFFHSILTCLLAHENVPRYRSVQGFELLWYSVVSYGLVWCCGLLCCVCRVASQCVVMFFVNVMSRRALCERTDQDSGHYCVVC